MSPSPPPSIREAATLACLLEAVACKPGNVHRNADFEDLTFQDMLVSGVCIGTAMESAATSSVGELVLRAVSRIRQRVGRNTYLGTVLLLAPLAKSTLRVDPASGEIQSNVAGVLDQLTARDAVEVYRAIQLAAPGGLGTVPEMDVRDPPPSDLRAAMKRAAEHDLVALQYHGNFHTIYQEVVPALRHGIDRGWPLVDAIVHAHVQLMADHPDSLIARKLGTAVAQRAQQFARAVIESGPPLSEPYRQQLANLDFWLRSDGHRRNPGTTADLIAGALFVLLRANLIPQPIR